MIIRKHPMNDYREMPGLSKHQLDNFMVAPAYYQHRKTQEWKPSRSMEMGTLIHEYVLEGIRNWAVGPVVDKRTKAGKEEWQLFCENNIGKMVVTPDEEAVILGCSKACSPLMEHLVYQPDDVEMSMFWERDGVACKGRPDLVAEINGEVSIIDLKTVAGIGNFEQSFRRFNYAIQAEWYSYGYNAIKGVMPKFWFLAVDTEAPHLAQFQCASSQLLEDASAKIEESLAYFKRCQDADVWPGLPEFKLILPW